eukprot:Rhum_TRINITY_DN3864_c0_g1::Rhum_TRINITY_DN3864_c0_g1_i1::g.12239::m.12239
MPIDKMHTKLALNNLRHGSRLQRPPRSLHLLGTQNGQEALCPDLPEHTLLHRRRALRRLLGRRGEAVLRPLPVEVQQDRPPQRRARRHCLLERAVDWGARHRVETRFAALVQQQDVRQPHGACRHRRHVGLGRRRRGLRLHLLQALLLALVPEACDRLVHPLRLRAAQDLALGRPRSLLAFGGVSLGVRGCVGRRQPRHLVGLALPSSRRGHHGRCHAEGVGARGGTDGQGVALRELAGLLRLQLRAVDLRAVRPAEVHDVHRLAGAVVNERAVHAADRRVLQVHVHDGLVAAEQVVRAVVHHDLSQHLAALLRREVHAAVRGARPRRDVEELLLRRKLLRVDQTGHVLLLLKQQSVGDGLALGLVDAACGRPAHAQHLREGGTTRNPRNARHRALRNEVQIL